MSRSSALDKLISIRHYCFVRGVLGKRSHNRKLDTPPDEDFRQAFRIVNRLYVEVRDGDRLKRHSGATRAPAGARTTKKASHPEIPGIAA